MSDGAELGHGYDVDDDFIDDSEIFDTPDQMAGKAKHSGFFINKVHCNGPGSCHRHMVLARGGS